jgi:hypothetical protein
MGARSPVEARDGTQVGTYRCLTVGAPIGESLDLRSGVATSSLPGHLLAAAVEIDLSMPEVCAPEWPTPQDGPTARALEADPKPSSASKDNAPQV